MARERTIQSFILKKQDYGEADQIITLFSKEEGKLRALVKAANLPASKLRPVLQPLFQTKVSLSGSSNAPGLSKVIGAQVVSVYGGILENSDKLSAWYIASELVIRALPDNQPNEQLFDELEQFAQFLHSSELNLVEIKSAITQFQIKALTALGLGIQKTATTTGTAATSVARFSLDRGGFIVEDTLDSIQISQLTYETFLKLSEGNYEVVKSVQEKESKELQNLVNRFVTYQLEREIKSQRQLN